MRVKRELEQLEKRLSDLETSLRTLEVLPRDLQHLREDVERSQANFELDFNSLYEKVRVNLAKLAKRATSEEGAPPETSDDVARARRQLLEKKLARR